MAFRHFNFTDAVAGLNDNDSDEELMRRVQSQDEAAFAALLTRHLGAIHAFVYRMCQNVEDAQDIAQETFLKVWSRAETWQPGRVKFTTWLHQIARNLCIDMFRKQPSRVTAEFDPELLGDSSMRTDELLVRNLQRAIGALPERQRAAFVLCQVQGWSQIEAAETLDISVEALESLLARARRKLRQMLADVRIGS